MSRRSTLRCASCRATYWSDDAHRCPKPKPRRWRKVGPHEYTLRMGPVTIKALDMCRGWLWLAVVSISGVPTTILQGELAAGVPLAQCQADAIAAVERWRDGIR